MNLPVEVLDAVREGRCVLFAGPRFASEAAELAGRAVPDDRKLARDLGWKRPRRIMGSAVRDKKPVTPSVVEGARIFEEAHGREALVGRMRLALGADGAAPTAAHRIALRRFDRIFTTAMDGLFEKAAAEAGHPLEVRYRGTEDAGPPAEGTALVKLRGGFEKPDSLVLTRADYERAPLPAPFRKAVRTMLRREVVFFVGYKPDEEDFELLWRELTECYGGELPRCHMAVAQGRIDDYLWQKWVWRGLLMFTADPVECLEELDARLEAGDG